WMFKRNGYYYIGFQSNCGYCSNNQNIVYKVSGSGWANALAGTWESIAATDISAASGPISCKGQGSYVFPVNGSYVYMIDTWQDQNWNEGYGGNHWELLSFNGANI